MTTALADRIQTGTTCPVCAHVEQARPLFQKSGIWIEECLHCRHRFAQASDLAQHVDAVYGDDYFNGGGAGYSNYLSESRLLRAHGRRYGKLLKKYAQPGRLLDVGAAAGFVLQGLNDEGWSGVGVEPNAAMARHAREQLGVDVTASPFEEFANTEPFDVVSIIQVMAHFVEPRVAVEHLASLVKPGGLCVVETWNVGSWSARLFGASWHEYSPPSVLHWWSPTTLSRLFGDFGFERVATGRPQKWIEVGHAKSLLGHKASAETSLIARMVGGVLRFVPDKWQLPYPSEDLFWAVFRKGG